MNVKRRNGQWATGNGRGGLVFLGVALLVAHCASGLLAVDTSPRVFFSDAKISFTYPNHWTLQPKFPYGPLFTKSIGDEGSAASISCAISAPLENNHVAADIPTPALMRLARRELELHQPGYRRIAERERRLSGRNGFEITWENVIDSQTLKHQTLYLFVEDRVYAFTLQAPPRNFLWAAPDFQHWIDSLRVLSRRDAGTLADPAHGGLWIHQTGGMKVSIPEPWLIAVSDDRSLGATYAQDDFHIDLTATLDLPSPAGPTFSARDKKEAMKAVHAKGLRIVRQSDDPFHGLPAFQVFYEGKYKERVVKGMDIWVLGAKARWLINLEGDVSLYNSLTDHYERVLNGIEFL